MASEKRCHYEVLGLSLDCTADEIRSAYKKLALIRHPDKLVKSGRSQAEATAQFQELVQAYEVLSDPKERAWYDSHRTQILFSDSNGASNANSSIPDLFHFFSNSVFSGYTDTGKGFYKVYSDLFDKIYANEINFAKILGLRVDSVREAPVMGNLGSPYKQASAFYDYWLGFCTIMDFGWVDQFNAKAGPDRRTRRFMEEENKKLRKKAKREYNETVRRLAEFVKKRDRRVIDMMVKREKERELKKEKEKEWRKKMEKEKRERASRYEDPEWARVKEAEEEGDEGQLDGDVIDEGGDEETKKNEFYCVVCGKKFKSDKQWKNHEQSKKHKEKVFELRKYFQEEEVEEEKEEEIDEVGESEGVKNDIEELKERFREELGVEEESGNGVDQLSNRDGEEEDDFVGVVDGDWVEVTAEDADDDPNENDNPNEDDDDDWETYVIEAMHRKKAGLEDKDKDEDVDVPIKMTLEDEKNDAGFMEYDNRKKMGRNQARRRNRGKKNGEAMTTIDPNETTSNDDGTNGHDNSHVKESHSFDEHESDDKRHESGDKIGDKRSKNHSKPNQSFDKKRVSKKETITKSDNSAKGKKGKASSKNSENVCDKCGEEFVSRTKLHKHLGETGHASLKMTSR